MQPYEPTMDTTNLSSVAHGMRHFSDFLRSFMKRKSKPIFHVREKRIVLKRL